MSARAVHLAARSGAVLLALAAATAAPRAAVATTYPGFMNLVTDSLAIMTQPNVVRPGYLVPTTDPVFGTPVIRIGGNTGSAVGNGLSGTWALDARHHYSKDQPWNADGTLLAIDNGSNLLMLDGETYVPRRNECSNYSRSDDRWHPSPQHANERINVNGSELMWFDVVRCVKTRTWQLPFTVDYFGPSEGNPSNDGRFCALTDGVRMFVVDMDPQAPFAPYPAARIGPIARIDDCGLSGGCRIDWVSVSPSGKYVVVNYDGDYLRVFDVDPNTLALTQRPMPAGSARCHGTAAKGFIYDLGHADMALNPFDNNEDVIIGQEHCGRSGEVVNGSLLGGVTMVRLRDGAVTGLTLPSNEAYPHHISTRNFDRPGWAYAGYHVETSGRHIDEIIAVKMDGSRTVQRFAHKHSTYSSCYRCESHAVPSRDGRRVLWASNWAYKCVSCTSSSDIKPYIVDARSQLQVPDNIPPAAITDLSRP